MTAPDGFVASGASDADVWDARYAQRGVWSGEPNEILVAEASLLSPGRALDVACGEGADAVWLAERGWTVTAVDVSHVAIERNRLMPLPEAAAGCITWQQADVARWAPPLRAFDLVTMQFMHPAAVHRTRVFRALADAVAPGGMLLIVAHHPNDVDKLQSRADKRGMLYSAEDVAAALDLTDWDSLALEARLRELSGNHGSVTVEDAVFQARRIR